MARLALAPEFRPAGYSATKPDQCQGRLRPHAYPLQPVIARSTALICHCEEHSDVAISMRLNTPRRTAVATATRLPRYARNDKVGTGESYAAGRDSPSPSPQYPKPRPHFVRRWFLHRPDAGGFNLAGAPLCRPHSVLPQTHPRASCHLTIGPGPSHCGWRKCPRPAAHRRLSFAWLHRP